MAAPRLLTVDDSELDCDIMEHTLRAAFPDAEIHRLCDPSTVEQLRAERAFDCVFLDYNMPQVDGLTLAGRLRAADTYLAIILVTSVGDEMLVTEALRAGVTDYIPKPRITSEALRRIVDRSLHASSQARVIDQQRGELENFAYALAHDFKQPIRQIITFSKMLGEEIRGGDPGEVQRHLNFLTHAATRLDKLVDVMLQYTLLNQPPVLSDIALDGVLASIRASLAPLLAERGGEFVTPRRAPRVRGNKTLMIQVLQNLVVNGLHYNRSPRPRVELTVERDGASWTIAVRDNGIGIEPQYLSEIFKPLIRLHAASEYSGSGLGLTLARKAMLAQHGEIWCDSTPGEGSVFQIRLPAAERRRERTANPAAA
jgi:signal transduction histidine kinase